MAIGQCKKCGIKVNPKVEKCPHCGAKIGNKTSSRVILVLIILILGCIGYFTDYVNNKKPTTPITYTTAKISPPKEKKDWKTQDNSSMAYNRMKDFIKERLKAPRSAKFPGIFEHSDHTKYLGNQRYRVISWVDAQNAFGATLRNYFVGEIKQTGEDYWALEKLEFIKR